MNSIDQAVREIWPECEDLHYEVLNGGYTNKTYKVFIDQKTYVLRLNGNQTDFLGLDRKKEFVAVEKAHELGIAPKVFDIENKKDYLVTEFVEGNLLEKSNVHNFDIIAQYISTLKKLHTISGVERRCTPYDLIEGYLNGVKEFGMAYPDGLDSILAQIYNIRNQREKYGFNEEKFCHNDYFAVNIINNINGLIVIDWELCGYGDVFFDLAALPYTKKLTEDEEKFLLKCYFGYYEDELFKILQDVKYVSLMREVGWALFHTAVDNEKVNHNLNYYKFALQVIDRMKNGHNTL